jgi:hypothetical protein
VVLLALLAGIAVPAAPLIVGSLCVQGGSMLLDMTRHAETVTSCAWLPDGKTFVTGSTDQKLTHWVRTFCMRSFSRSTLNSASVLVSFVRVQDMKGNSLYTWLGEIVLDLAVTPDGTRVVTVSPR